MTKIPGIDVEPIENFEFAKERRLFYVDFTRARFETNLVCENKNLSEFAEELQDEEHYLT